MDECHPFNLKLFHKAKYIYKRWCVTILCTVANKLLSNLKVMPSMVVVTAFIDAI